MRLRYPRVQRVALGPDGTDAAGFPGHEVDVGKLPLVERVLGAVPLHQLFEEAALFCFRPEDGTDAVQRSLKAVS